MGRLRATSDYENLRNARILENQARLESLGVHNTISELRSITSSAKRKYCKVDYRCTPLRRSNRLMRISGDSTSHPISLKAPLKEKGAVFKEEENELSFGVEKKPANSPLVILKDIKPELSTDDSARRCSSKGRGSVYDPVFGICCHFCRQKKLDGEDDCNCCGNLDMDQPCLVKTDCSVCHSSNGVLCRACLKVRFGEEMDERLRAKSDYENLRNARIRENQARLESLGLHKTISELRSITSSAKKKYCKVDYRCGPLRRSNRLMRISTYSTSQHISLQLSSWLEGASADSKLPLREKGGVLEVEENVVGLFRKGEEKRPANSPLVRLKGTKPELSPDDSARRCSSKGRGSVYDPVFGICCHFCRQKKLCGEDDCKRCGNLDMDQPCLGKTDCSVCHSSNGVLCRACLKVRYGEEMEEVRENKQWMCPHCIEDKGIKPNWICNSSLCLKKRKMAPTGIAIYRARGMGYQSVAHLLMDELGSSKKRR